MDDFRLGIRDFISREIMLEPGPSSVTLDTKLVGGVLDSLGLMQLVSYIQEELGVTFEETDVTPENFRTIDTVERLVAEKVDRGQKAASISHPPGTATPAG